MDFLKGIRSGENNNRPPPKAAVDSYEVFLGPSYLQGLPALDEWRAFNGSIQDPESLAFAELWQKKATIIKGVPLRKDLGFRDLVRFGRNLVLYKRTNDDRWLTTFCGDEIVQNVGIELTGKCLDEYADKDTLEYWMQNIEYVCNQGKPIMEFYTLDHASKDYSLCQSLNLPLRSNNSDLPDMFVCHEVYSDESTRI